MYFIDWKKGEEESPLLADDFKTPEERDDFQERAAMARRTHLGGVEPRD